MTEESEVSPTHRAPLQATWARRPEEPGQCSPPAGLGQHRAPAHEPGRRLRTRHTKHTRERASDWKRHTTRALSQTGHCAKL